MSPDEFRRELRKDPSTDAVTIVLPDFEGDVSQILNSLDGDKISFVPGDRAGVTVISPNLKLFFLEEPKISVGDTPMYDRAPAFGAHERFIAEPATLSGLETLIKALGLRSADLRDNASDRGSRHFYAYASFDPLGQMLTGTLLASREFPPAIVKEVFKFDEYAGYHKRCLNCDIERQERASKINQESRLVRLTKAYTAFIPFAPRDKLHTTILPVQHIKSLGDLTNEQLNELASIVYDTVNRVVAAAKKDQRYMDAVEVAIHTAPIADPRPSNAKTKEPLDEIYHLHIEILPIKNPMYGYPVPLSLSGWQVIGGRPKETAEMLRQVLNHQP